VLLENEFRGKWYTIDPTRINYNIMNSGKALWKNNTTRFIKAGKDALQYGVQQNRRYVM